MGTMLGMVKHKQGPMLLGGNKPNSDSNVVT
ncbi:hypothetical protein Tco_1294244, partial [Tanacetum coccineum]